MGHRITCDECGLESYVVSGEVPIDIYEVRIQGKTIPEGGGPVLEVNETRHLCKECSGELLKVRA